MQTARHRVRSSSQVRLTRDTTSKPGESYMRPSRISQILRVAAVLSWCCLAWMSAPVLGAQEATPAAAVPGAQASPAVRGGRGPLPLDPRVQVRGDHGSVITSHQTQVFAFFEKHKK